MKSFLYIHKSRFLSAVLAISLMLLLFLYTFTPPLVRHLTLSRGSVSEPVHLTQTDAASSTQISAESGILMEASTGTVVFQKDATKEMAPASITKIMTLLLCFEALEQGRIQLTDEVSVSEYAASMGGSQVFLEPGEIQTVDTLIKCVSIASANDGAVALAEHIAGTEAEFVAQMNARAKELGMSHTFFVNCCGLDAQGHYTCAYDIALMSRELITRHPQIHDYCKVWQEDITHVTRKGSTPFTLTNTNKLIKQYPYATGLKTGSTSTAKYCVSATASKDGLSYIAVIMAAPDHKVRFTDATNLLNYGFASTSIYRDEDTSLNQVVSVSKGTLDEVPVKMANSFHYLSTTGENLTQVERKIDLPANVTAPIKKGKQIGTVTYCLGDKDLGKVPIITTQNVPSADLLYYIQDIFQKLLPVGAGE